MEKSFSESYKNAGVDVTAGYKSVELMKKTIKSTYNEGVIGDIGGFGRLVCAQYKRYERTYFSIWNRWCWNQTKISLFNEQTQYNWTRLCCDVC